MLLDLWEATIVQADKYMQSNSFKEDSQMIEQNFKVSYETYEQLGMDEYSISASNYLQGYPCGKELQSSRHKVFSYQQRARSTGIKVRTIGVCIYPQGYFGGRELQNRQAQSLEKTSEGIFGTLRCTKQSSGVRGSPGESSYENLVLELAKII